MFRLNALPLATLLTCTFALAQVPAPAPSQPGAQPPSVPTAPVVENPSAPTASPQALPQAEQPTAHEQAQPQQPAMNAAPAEAESQPTEAKPPKPAKEKAEKADSGATDNDSPIRPDQIHNPVLWHDPGNIASLNLYYGQGGEAGAPKGPYTFLEEDMNGTNPKFDAQDATGKKWRVKLGSEARPEVVASRLLWASGYYVNDDYVVPSAYVDNLHMKRGNNLIKNDHINEARFARKPEGQKKIGTWEWKQNPFLGTREYNGLRVMMAVMNGWDLKDVNNAVYKQKGSDKQIFLVSDIGATFASTDFSLTKSRSKGNVKQFEKSKFITRMDHGEIDFATPSKPTGLLLETMGLEAKEYSMRSGFVWIGHNIPRGDAKWIGSLLGQLSHEQIVDAFRAGHFPPKAIDTYVRIVEERIAELKAL